MINGIAQFPPKPAYPAFKGLPDFPAIRHLRDFPQFVSWDYVWKPDRGKWDKPPVNPHTGRFGSHSAPATWGSYEQAAERSTREGMPGVGFVLTPDDEITGGDIDKVRDPLTGDVEPWVREIIALGETYCEWSPSGTGLRFFAAGKIAETVKNDPAHVELYHSQRFLTLTGQHVAGTPIEILPAPRTIAVLMARVDRFKADADAQREKAAEQQRGAGAYRLGKLGDAVGLGSGFFFKVNEQASGNLSRWVPDLFPSAKFSATTGGYRVTSKRLGRHLEEDLSITPNGTKDFGLHDIGDAKGGKRSPIDLVMEHGGAPDAAAAAHWLCDRLGIDPASLGWEARGERQSQDGQGGGKSEDRRERLEQPAGDWKQPQPLPTGLLPVAAFDPDILPSTISPWVQDIAERMQCPPDFVGISAVVGLATVLGRKIAVKPQARTDWGEVPNLWGCIVGRPGAMKSPAMSEALRPLSRLEGEARKANEDDLTRYRQAMLLHKVKLEVAQADAKKAMKEGRQVSSIDVDEPEKPEPKRFMTNDTTYEALGVIMSANPNGVLVFRDELVSLLKTLDREEYAAARGFYLTAWNGTSGYSFDRIVRNLTHVDAVCASMLGSTQPGRLTEYLSRALTGSASDDGLIQRFGLLVWPDDQGSWKEVDRYPDSAARERAWTTFARLDRLTADGAEAEQGAGEAIPFLRFDDGARDEFLGWRVDLETRVRSGVMHSALESHLSKYRKLVPALALINHLAEGQRGPVCRAAVLQALAFAEYLETHARRAYRSGTQTDVSSATAILARIRKGDIAGDFTARDILQREWSNLSQKESVVAGLDLLDELHWVTARDVKTGGRPKTIYTVNPRGQQ